MNRESLETWLERSVGDAERRGFPELKPLMEALGQATETLRDAVRGGEPPSASLNAGAPAAALHGPVRVPSPLDPRLSTIEAFGRSLRAGKISAAEMLEECLRRIDADAVRLNAFILVMADEARRSAHDRDVELARGRDLGPLPGVPVLTKDPVDVHGMTTTAASP